MDDSDRLGTMDQNLGPDGCIVSAAGCVAVRPHPRACDDPGHTSPLPHDA